MPPFDWDLKKEEQNIQKHGVDFATASQLWGGSVFERVDSRRDYGRPGSWPLAKSKAGYWPLCTHGVE
jgi:uncharacterized DUF497 family protein